MMDSSADKNPTIIVIGAGLAGLSIAKLLHTRGFSVAIYEKSSRTHNQGYGIALRSWAYQPLRDGLALENDAVFKKVCATDRAAGGLGYIDPTIRSAQTNEDILQLQNPSAPAATTDSVFRANRAALREFLSRDLDIHYEHALQAMNVDPLASNENESVTLQFRNGTKTRCALVIAADGVQSTIREQLMPDVRPQVHPAVVYLGMQQLPRSHFEAVIQPLMRNSNVVAGVADFLNVALQVVNITDSTVDMCWTYVRRVKGDEVSDPLYRPTREDADARIVPPELLEEIEAAELDMPFRDLVSASAIHSHGLYHWKMMTVDIPLEHLHDIGRRYRTVFVGDAAHAMPIFSGEGGNHALLDAVELATQLRQKDMAPAVQDFYSGCHTRWQNGLHRSVERLPALCRSLDEWRAMAKKLAASKS